jgi:serralysin
LAFGAGNDAELKALFDPLIINNSGINWNGTPAIWLMDGTNPIGGGVVNHSNPWPSWRAVGAGDFNGDGKADILWQNTDGTPAIWLMDGTNPIGRGVVNHSNPGPSWRAVGAGDFNRDGKADILWQNTEGRLRSG